MTDHPSLHMLIDGERIAAGDGRVNAGMVEVNMVMMRRRPPGGGVKWWGHGHEDGAEGMMARLVLKAIHEG